MTAQHPPPAAAAHPGSGLERYRWKARLLLISAPSQDDLALKAQRAALAAQAQELQARDMVVLELIGDRPPAADPTLGVEQARHAAGLSSTRFGVALIGKDGHVARRENSPIGAEALFAVIDAMPMRKDEMRRR